MISISSVGTVLFIILPIVLAQYIYATFALVRLARARLSALSYTLWNLFIVLVFFIGSTAFLIYDAKKKKISVRDKSPDESENEENAKQVKSGKWDV